MIKWPVYRFFYQVISRSLKPLCLSLIILGGAFSNVLGQVVSCDSVKAQNVFFRLSNFGEKVLEKVTWENKGRVLAIYPSGGYSPRNGLEFGVMPAFKWPAALPDWVNTLSAGLEGSTGGMLQLQAEYEWFIHENWQSRGQLTWNNRNDRFWPRGQTDFITFDRREFSIQGELLRHLSSKLWAGILLQSTFNKFGNIEAGEGPGQLVNGLEGGAVLGAGPLLVFDSRNRVLSPQKGGLLRVHYLFFGPGELGDYSYNQWMVDGRWYLPIIHWNSVVAFQLLGEYGGDGMPFYQAPQLGGKDRLRGIGHPLRMTGQSLWMARGEFRQPLWWRLSGVVFGGAGRTASTFDHPLTDVIGSGGCGLRFRMLPHDPLNVRVDFGVSTLGDSGFFISLKEAF